MIRLHFARMSMAALCLTAVPALAAEEETLLLQQPTISKTHLVFVYAQDLWIVPRAGGEARRLTSSPGSETSPELSPDGKLVAFTGEYEGNADVYVMPVEGGRPKRLTWHPGPDVVQDWHPDGRRVLFTSMRNSGQSVMRLFLANLDGGTPRPLALPRVSHASYNDAGTRLAYTPIRDAFRSWKRYRGGRVSKVWIYDPETHEVDEVPHVNASDSFPAWAGEWVYFASDRDDRMNLWRWHASRQQLEQVTRFPEFDVRNLDAIADAVVFEQAGALHVHQPSKGTTTRLRIRVPADGLHALPRWQAVKGAVRAASIAPNGKRAVFETRGEIVTVPREHGDVRNLTQSPSAHDRSPVWSPDGKKIAWFSDASGEYQLVVKDRLGREEPKTHELAGRDAEHEVGGFYYAPSWSPDGKHILYRDKTNRLAFITLETGTVTEVARAKGSLGVLSMAAVWSADSKWICYEKRNPQTSYDSLWLYELASRRSARLTDHFADAGTPAFSRDGRHLFFTASVDSGPKQFGLDMSSGAARSSRNNIYCAVLQKDAENPLAPKSDEGVQTEKDKKAKKKKKGANDEETAEKKKTPPLDLEGLDQRILALPLSGSRYAALECSAKKLLFVEAPLSGDTELKSFDFDSRKATTVASKVRGVEVSADGKHLLVAGSGGFVIMDDAGKNKKTLKVDSIRVRVDPEQEWPQILREVWRIQRDYFYDPAMHGIDWSAMWARWRPFVRHVRHRSDLNVVIAELIGELSCGHQYVSGGQTPEKPAGVSVGLLGADFAEAQGRHRITKIYEGQNWNPGLRAPLTEPGVEAHVGDYLISVNGRPVTAQDNLFAAFENTAGKRVDLELSGRPDGTEARKVTVVPIASESSLRQRSWVEGNRKRVAQRSGGRLAYIHMPDTGNRGMRAFDRDFFSQLDKEGLILDERFNRGGKVADYVIDMLSRQVRCYWMNREQWCSQTPFGTFRGPMVMVANERAGSGGDCMPWLFKKAGLGPLVGTRTWGGLVGISGYPPLMDGGRVTAASFGVMDTDGSWAVENVGVAPDHEVIEWPKAIIEEGADPQLDKAIELAMAALKKTKRPRLPTYKPPAKR